MLKDSETASEGDNQYHHERRRASGTTQEITVQIQAMCDEQSDVSHSIPIFNRTSFLNQIQMILTRLL